MLESKNVYRLPFSRLLNIKPELAPFHYELEWMKHAVDFAMNEETPVMAALDGVVLKVIDKFDSGGPERFFLKRYNSIIIQHLNDEYSEYVHLRKGRMVQKGEVVKEGSIIAHSGNSSFVTYSHLHFQVMTKDRNDRWQTIPTRFRMSNGIFVLSSPRE